MNTTREELKHLAINLIVGETLRCKCPLCGVAEKSCTVSRTEEGLIYNCYRLSCSLQGFISSLPGALRPSTKPKKPKVFTRPLQPLTEKLVEYLSITYNLTQEELYINGFKHDYTAGRLYMPIFNHANHQIGAVAKALPRTNGTKAIAYWSNPEVTGMHYPVCNIDAGPIVVVEDILSSIRVARHYRCVALLGTNITNEMITELQQQTKHLVLALDPDAVGKAFSWKRKYNLFFRNFEVKVLSNDPKDLDDITLVEELTC